MIKVLKGTETPLSDMGVAAGTCWHANVTDLAKNVKRAMDCIESGHGRVMEYPDVTLLVDGYSARCIRELYTHIIGTTRLQESTRYVDCENFQFYNPFPEGSEQRTLYEKEMENIRKTYIDLLNAGASKEDAANILPLGMFTSIVWKINLRAIEHFAAKRMCSRAYKEIRNLAKDLKKTLSEYSEEWKQAVSVVMVPECEKYKYINPNFCFCAEKSSCGKYPKVKNLKIVSEKD